MATGGGKPGIAVKSAVIAEPQNGRIIVIPKHPDPALWKYFAQEGSDEFLVLFSDATAEHSDGGNNQQGENT
jgi:hypothetical protein